MIDKLTEELKAAGFPNIGAAWMDKESGTQVFHEVPGWEEIYIPVSLEELINAFASGISLVSHGETWKASKNTSEYWVGIGATPTEAAGRLWLLINTPPKQN